MSYAGIISEKEKVSYCMALSMVEFSVLFSKKEGMNMKKRWEKILFSAAVISMMAATVCLGAEGVDSTEVNSEAAEEGMRVSNKNLTEMIMKDGKLVPGNGLEWGMSCEEFLAGEYSSEEMDPESDKFEEYRASEMPNGMFSYMPKVTITMEEYEDEMDMTCIFDQDKKLIKVCYRQMMPVDQCKEYLERMQKLLGEIQETKELEPEEQKDEELTEERILEEPISLKWNHTDKEASLHINSVKFDDSLIMDLILSQKHF